MWALCKSTAEFDAVSSLCIHLSICQMGMPIPSGKLGLSVKESVVTCKKPSLVPIAGVNDLVPGALHESGIPYPF